MRKILAVAGIAALALTCGRADDTTSTAGGSGSASANPADITVGVAMPTKTSERWIKDGDYMKQQLEAAGYKVNLQYANDDIPTQVTQIQDMVTNIKAAFVKRIEGLTWMAPATKAEAKKKVETMSVGVGYPDSWKDYSPLQLAADSAYANKQATSKLLGVGGVYQGSGRVGDIVRPLRPIHSSRSHS